MMVIYSTCTTPGCWAAGIQVALVDPEPLVICGVCCQDITDLQKEPTPLPTEVPEWLE